MGILRLTIFQETAHFRIPTSGAPAPLLTYPLPPPSTVFGFLRRITKSPEINYKNVALSIQGKWSSMSSDIERLLFFEYRTQKETKEIFPDKFNVVKVHKLHECTWVIHIKSSEDIIGKICEAVDTYPHAFRLGRKEDLIVNIEKDIVSQSMNDYANLVDINQDNYIYLPWGKEEKHNFLTGNIYRATLDTIIENNTIKELVYIPLIFDSTESVASNEGVYIDGEYPIVWLNSIS